MSHSVIYDPWCFTAGYTFSTWRYLCDPCGEAFEITGDKPPVAPFCASGHRMVDAPQAKRSR